MKPTVAIACQGGGSHAAFAAGVLSELLTPANFSRYELLGLSGTSGGAVCAALAWSGLITETGNPAAEARRRLHAFWRDLATNAPLEWAMNVWSVWMARLPIGAEISPYLFDIGAAQDLRRLLGEHLRLEALPADPARRSRPKLLVGATDIQEGRGVVLHGEDLRYDDIIASAAVPPLFRAVATRGRLFWDGLFTRNPPIHAFTELPAKPDEIWVVQINPQRRETEPTTMPEIIDRRNELAGNLSLAQELDAIETINKLAARHATLRDDGYKHITIRVVGLDLDLDYPSKLDRDAAHIERLMQHGQEKARQFFAGKSVRHREPRDAVAAQG